VTRKNVDIGASRYGAFDRVLNVEMRYPEAPNALEALAACDIIGSPQERCA